MTTSNADGIRNRPYPEPNGGHPVEQELRRQEEVAEREHFARFIAETRLSKVQLKMSWANYMTTPENAALVKSPTAGKNLFITGPTGTGKTHFAVAQFKTGWGNRRGRHRFWSVAELCLFMRSEGRKEISSLIDDLTKCDQLVLDDWGAERTTEYVVENLYLIVDRWYNADKSGLIITSNLSLSELADKMDDRLASRIAGMCDVHHLTGKDWRLNHAPVRAD